MKTTRRDLSSLLIAAAVLAGCASAPRDGTDPALLQRMDGALRQASPALPVSLKLSSDMVRTGDVIGASVSSPVGGYVYLFQLGSEGKALSLVFPNAMDGANFLAPGAAMMLPRPNWRMAARGPAGIGYLMAVVTDKPMDLMALQANTPRGEFGLTTPYGASMVTLREVTP